MNGEPDPYCDEILAGRLSVNVVVDEDEVLAFHHPSPSFAPVQIVVIPKRHISSLADLADGDMTVGQDLTRVLARIAREVVGEFGAARVVTNLGDLQHSRHLHWHVIVNPERQPPGLLSANPAAVDVAWRTYWSERRWEFE